MPEKNFDLCPFAKIVPLKCGMQYRLDEFYRQMDTTMKSGKQKYIHTDPNTRCACDPEICQRYVKHMIANQSKYNQK